MIHRAACGSYGNAADKLDDATMLEVHDEEMSTIYSAKTGKSKKAIMEAMVGASGQGTWMTSEEAVAFGLADENPDADTPAALGEIDLKQFKNVPEKFLASIRKQTAVLAGGNPKNTMNKKKLVAFLKTKDIEASEDWTDEQFESALNKIGMTTEAGAAVVAPASAGVTQAEIASLRASLDAERLTRISAEVRRRGQNKIPNASMDWWIKNALANETDTFATIDALEDRSVGGRQIGNAVTITAERPLDTIKAKFPGKLNSKARYETIKADFRLLMEDAQARDRRSGLIPERVTAEDWRRGPALAANTYSASLVTNFLLDGSVTILQNKWAPLRAFLRDYSTDRYKPLATAQLKLVTTTDGLVQTNATNFEQGDSTVTNVSIAVNHYSRSFHVTDSELNEGLRMENLLEINMSVFADKIIQLATAPITGANFNVLNALVSTPGNFNWAAMQQLWGLLKKSPIHNVLLDGEYLAQILNVPTQFQKSGEGTANPGAWNAFGWDNICLNTNWTGADPNVRGFACNPQAIGAVSGLPLTPPNIPGGTLMEATMEIPGPDITIQNYMWFSLSSRTMWCSFDLMFGAALLDNTAGAIIRSA
jgi:hypothetical protein